MKTKAVEPFRFDGHGINDAEGSRLAKLSEAGSISAYIGDGSGIGVKRNPEFDKLGELLAKAPEMRDTLRECANWLRELNLRHESVYTSELIQRIDSLTGA